MEVHLQHHRHRHVSGGGNVHVGHVYHRRHRHRHVSGGGQLKALQGNRCNHCRMQQLPHRVNNAMVRIMMTVILIIVMMMTVILIIVMMMMATKVLITMPMKVVKTRVMMMSFCKTQFPQRKLYDTAYFWLVANDNQSSHRSSVTFP